LSPIAVDIINPRIQSLREAGRPLHLLAAILIFANAFLYFQLPGSSKIYFWSQLIVAADILILFFAGKDLLRESPGFNLFFRLAECIVFLTFAALLLSDSQWMAGIMQASIALLYGYIFYCEKKSFAAERISIQHLGINLPGIFSDRFIPWIEINHIEADHAEFIIYLSTGNKQFHFKLTHHLKLEELEIIQSYCRHYLPQKP
jgi:hypothetical protein